MRELLPKFVFIGVVEARNDQIQRFELSALATIHKSQGRSVDTVFIDTDTVLKRPSWLSCEEHKRSLYTAITRARKRVVFHEMLTFCAAKQTSEVDAVPTGQVG